jgi:hypothetical protein
MIPELYSIQLNFTDDARLIDWSFHDVLDSFLDILRLITVVKEFLGKLTVGYRYIKAKITLINERDALFFGKLSFGELIVPVFVDMDADISL